MKKKELFPPPFVTQTILMFVDEYEPIMYAGQSEWDAALKEQVAQCFKEHAGITDEKKANEIADYFYEELVSGKHQLSEVINATLQEASVTDVKKTINVRRCLSKIQYTTLKQQYGSMFGGLFAALVEGESIIIATSSLVNYVMRYIKEISDNPFQLKSPTKIDPKKWIAKQVTNYLYIFIPKEYLKTRYNRSLLENINTKDYSYTNTKGIKISYGLDELAIGLKLEDKKRIKDDDFMKPETYASQALYPKARPVVEQINQKGQSIGKSTWNVSWLSQHVIANLKNMFIAEHEYKKIFSDLVEEELKVVMPASAVILLGHGSSYISLQKRIKRLKDDFSENASEEIERLQELVKKGETMFLGGSIGGFNPDDFAKFINFLPTINTKFFFSSTCYGSSEQLTHALKKFSKEKSLSDIVFSFPIISGAIVEAVTKGVFSTDSDNLVLTRPVVKNFFDMLNTKEQSLFVTATDSGTTEEIVKNVPSEQTMANALSYIYKFDPVLNNVPIIKWKDLPWRPLALPEKTVVIGDVLARSYTKEALNVAKFFNVKKLDILAFNTLRIPFTLEMSGLKSFPSLIPLMPGSGFYRVKSLDAKDFNIAAVMNFIMPMEGLEEYKIFNFQELHVTNDTEYLDATLKKKIILYNVLIYNGPSGKGVYFRYQGKFWYANLNEQDFENFIAGLTKIVQKDGSVITQFKEPDGNSINFNEQEINQILKHKNSNKFWMTLKEVSESDYNSFIDSMPDDIKSVSLSERDPFLKLMETSLQKKIHDIKKKTESEVVDIFAQGLQTVSFKK